MKLNINGKEVEVSNEDLAKALEEKKESFEIASDDFVIRTTEEDTTFKNNIRQEGVVTGTEIGRKNVIKGLGIEAEGAHKNDESAINALNSWSQSQVTTALDGAKVEPNKQIEGFKTDIETLKGTIGTLTGERDAAINEFNGYKKTQTIKSTLSSLMPDNTVLGKKDMLTLVGGQIKADIDENGNVFAIGADGQPMKDKTTLDPLPMKQVITNFFDENPQYIKPTTGGGGGGDSDPGQGGKQSVDDFTEEMKKAGKPIGSQEFVNEMMARQKAGTLTIE